MIRATERGNAVIFILLGIALFAALAYTFMRSAQTGQGNLTAGQTRLLAQKMINASLRVERATNKLLARGCSENELNFYDPQMPLSLNPDAPPDGRCDIFSAQGTGGSAEMFAEYTTDSGAANNLQVHKTKTTEPDILYWYQGVSRQLCVEINRQLGIHNPAEVPQDTTLVAGVPFTGTFSTGAAESYNDEDVRIYNAPAACVHITGVDIYAYYKLLLDR